MFKTAGSRSVKTDAITIEFDNVLKEFQQAVNLPTLQQALRATFKRIANSAITGKNSAAAKKAFGAGGRYAITKKVAFEKGQFRSSMKFVGGDIISINLLATITGRSIGFHHFPLSASRKKVPIGPKQKKAWRQVIKGKILRDKPMRVVRPSGRKGAPRKRWPAADPAELGGFMAVAMRGRIPKGGSNMVFMRSGPPLTASRADRKPIQPMFTMSIAEMMINSKTMGAINERLGERLPIEFAGRMNYYLNIKGGYKR